MSSHPKVSKGKLIQYLKTQGVTLSRENLPTHGRMWVVTNKFGQRQVFPSLLAVATWISYEQQKKDDLVHQKLQQESSSDPVENIQSEPQDVPEGQNTL